MDGWNTDELENVIDVCDKIYDLAYEIKNCIKGSYTGITTYRDLGEYIKELADDLADTGQEISNNEDYLEDLDKEAEYEEVFD